MLPSFGLILLSLTSATVFTEVPTFNCQSKELSTAEKLICYAAELAVMDRELAEVFAITKPWLEPTCVPGLPDSFHRSNYPYTLSVTDIATGWVENRAIWG